MFLKESTCVLANVKVKRVRWNGIKQLSGIGGNGFFVN